jgi:MFS family permease
MNGGIAGFFNSPAGAILVVLMILPVGYLMFHELRKIPSSLHVLMWTAFIDMLGMLMVLPLLPFYAEQLGGEGFDIGLFGWSFHVGIGLISAMLVTAFTVAMLISAPLWGRFSDRWGRKPALLIALGASAVAFFIFGYATSLFVLFLSRIVQGAGGGTVGVIQAYVADATEPQNRARSLGWLSAATNAGVALGPVLGSLALTIGANSVEIGGRSFTLGRAAPGVFAGLLCLVNMAFAWRYLGESRPEHPEGHPKPESRSSRSAVMRVVTHSGEPAARLIWIYAIAMGAFNGVTAILALFLADRFAVNEKTIGFFFTYIGVISVLTRVLVLGRAVDWLGEAKLSRIGSAMLALGLIGISLATSLPMLALAVALVPLGTAFTFPCVTALLSRVIAPHERGLYMGVQQTFGGVARVFFPLLAGLMFDHLGKAVPFWISAALVAGTIMLSLGLDRRPKAQVANA